MKHFKRFNTYAEAQAFSSSENVNLLFPLIISNKQNNKISYNEDCGELHYVGFEQIDSTNYQNIASKIYAFQNEENVDLSNAEEFADYVYILVKDTRTVLQIEDPVTHGIVENPVDLISQFNNYKVYKTVNTFYGQIKIIYNE